MDGLSSIILFFHPSFSRLNIQTYLLNVQFSVCYGTIDLIGLERFKLPIQDWRKYSIVKCHLSSFNRHIKASTLSSYQLKTNSKINLSYIKKADKLITTSVGIDKFPYTKLLNKFTKCCNSIKIRISVIIWKSVTLY